MNNAQLRAVQDFTNRIHRYNLMASVDSTLNGNFAFRLLDWGNDRHGHKLVVVEATNTDSLKWFETHQHIIAVIGPRGGVDIRICEGIWKRSLIS